MLRGGFGAETAADAPSLENYLADNLNAWELRSDGTYRKLAPQDGAAPHSAQTALLSRICG